jgi:hypothetical protein
MSSRSRIDEIADTVNNMAALSSPKWCCLHVNFRTKGDIIAFKDKGWKKFIECGSRWYKLDCSGGETNRDTAHLLGVNNPEV